MRWLKMLPLAAALMLAAPAAAQADFMHVVTPGETLTSIAATDGLTVDQLALANGISPNTKLIAGSTLAIPPQDAPGTAAVSTSTTETPAAAGSYVVQPGDTLTGIAARAGTSVSELAALNGLNPNDFLLYGTVLRLPGASATAPVVSAASSEPEGAQAEGSASGPPYPTPQRVSGSEIASIAEADGVPPALAEAIGWQESGFNNDLVSSVGARGVMQILPGTWNWIGQDLNSGMPLAPDSALDNVRGGVIMLRALLDATGGNQAEAAAGYYQGLSSVQQHGMYPSTKQYVNDVLSLERQFGGG